MAKKQGNKAAKGNGKTSNATTLAEICKECKIEPRAARRKLRGSDISVEGGRWEWTKASDVAKVKRVLQPAKD